MEISIILFFISTLGCIVVGFFCGARLLVQVESSADKGELSSLREAKLEVFGTQSTIRS